MEVNLIIEALKFMMLGMGVVFTFLIIMIFLLKLQGTLVSRYFPQKGKESTTSKLQASTAVNQTTKIAAIVAAVQHHKNIKG